VPNEPRWRGCVTNWRWLTGWRTSCTRWSSHDRERSVTDAFYEIAKQLTDEGVTEDIPMSELV
jgi:hypothetical protein